MRRNDHHDSLFEEESFEELEENISSRQEKKEHILLI